MGIALRACFSSVTYVDLFGTNPCKNLGNQCRRTEQKETSKLENKGISLGTLFSNLRPLPPGKFPKSYQKTDNDSNIYPLDH